MKYAVLAGRQLFSIVFIIASAGHFNAQTIASAARHGVPLPDILVPLSGMIALAGGLSVLFGYQTRFGAWLLVLFLVPVTLIMHNFWAVWDPATSQIEKAMFMKNVTMLGGALLISYFGPGPLSLDAFVEREKQLTDAKTATGGSGCCHNNAYGNREWLSPPGGRFTFATTTRRPMSGTPSRTACDTCFQVVRPTKPTT